ncbi:hypothetical protein IAS59_004679 [Cryptococcus gattii]
MPLTPSIPSPHLPLGGGMSDPAPSSQPFHAVRPLAWPCGANVSMHDVPCAGWDGGGERPQRTKKEIIVPDSQLGSPD